MGRYQREKGKRGEREVAQIFKQYGLTAERTAQHCGKSPDSSDVRVKELPQLYVECKVGYSKQNHVWFTKALDDAGPNKLPLIFHKCDGGSWLCTVDAAWLVEWIADEHRKTQGS